MPARRKIERVALAARLHPLLHVDAETYHTRAVPDSTTHLTKVGARINSGTWRLLTDNITRSAVNMSDTMFRAVLVASGGLCGSLAR